MQYSTDERIGRNVGQDADLAYVNERGIKIERGMLEQWPVGTCARCAGTIFNAPFLSASEPGVFCSRVCRDANKPNRPNVGGRPRLTKKQVKKSAKARVQYQRDYMRSSRMLAKNPSQDTDSKEVKTIF